MDIKYLGHASFFIKGREAKLITDPFDPKMVGLKFPKTEADIVTISHQHQDHNYLSGISGNPLIIDWPGQFERKKMRVAGFRSFHDKKQGSERGENILYRIDDDNLSLLHCGDLGFVPDDKFLDEIGEIDILMIGVGGETATDAAEAIEIIKKIEPAIVIPMHYKTSNHNELWKNKAPVSDFLKKISAENIIPIPKLTVKKEELGEEMKVIVMEVSN